jgi:hypothetical protein
LPSRPLWDGARSAPAGPAARWHLSATTAAGWAVAVALLMSTQYLVQPFVWNHWPVDAVLEGWAEVVRDRALVALLIAFALVAVTRLPARSTVVRAGLVAVAIVCGAGAGEFALVAAGASGARPDLASVLGRIVQWAGLALCVSGMFGLWTREQDARFAARSSALRRSATESMVVQAQLQSLRQQIEPHFLFNTLATIRRLQETEPLQGSQLLRHLIWYLRSAQPVSGRSTTLGDEADLVASYLAIVTMRMTGHLAIEIDIPHGLRTHACPPLTLATLVENAVKHGITPAPEGGAIRVQARRVGNELEIIVADTGVGISAPTGASAGGTGMGLANIRARLRVLHGRAASLTLSGNRPRGVCATIRLPLERASRP